MRSIEVGGAQLAELIAASGDAPVVLIDDGRPVAAVVSMPYLATLDLSASRGTREAIAEGLADLAAHRAEPWAELRRDYGRSEESVVPAPHGDPGK